VKGGEIKAPLLSSEPDPSPPIPYPVFPEATKRLPIETLYRYAHCFDLVRTKGKRERLSSVHV